MTQPICRDAFGSRMRLGRRQLERLVSLCSLHRSMLAPDPVAMSLVRRGLLRESDPPGAVCITAWGLRALADQVEAGLVPDGLQRMEAEKDRRDAA